MDCSSNRRIFVFAGIGSIFLFFKKHLPLSLKKPNKKRCLKELQTPLFYTFLYAPSFAVNAKIICFTRLRSSFSIIAEIEEGYLHGRESAKTLTPEQDV